MYLRLSPYREVLQGVLISLQINEGIIKITGKDGSGKTALCSQLFQELQGNGQPAVFFLKPPSSAIALQNDILDNLALDPTGNFTRTLTAFLLARASEQKPLVLIFDDAQQLDPPTFSAIRMLCNIQDESRALVRVILCGNDELDDRLAGPALRAVTQFVNQSFTLPYLTQEQVHDFCQGFWMQAGEEMKPLSERVLEKLFQETKGHPGILQARLNQGTTGAERSERFKETAVEPPVRPYRYKGRKPGWLPAVAIIAGLALLGSAGAYLYLTPAAPVPELARNMVEGAPELVVAIPAPIAAAPVESEVVTVAAPPEPVIEETASAPDPSPSADPAVAAAADIPVETVEPAPAVVEASPAPDVEAPAAEEAPAPVDVVQTPAPATDATPLPEEPALPPVEEFINSWTASWQSQDVDAYLAHYHPDFVPAQGSQDEWRQQRRRVIGNASGISVNAEALESTSEAEDGAQVVRFWLDYSAANYADRTLKELVLAPVDGAWRIRAETSLQTERR